MSGYHPSGNDTDAALNAAMLIFWARGYEGTTMSELMNAMGMSASSVYNVFGDKAALFKRVVEYYLAGPGGYLEAALEQRTAAAVVRGLLNAAICTVAGDHTPHGCLTVQGALVVGPRSQPAQALLAVVSSNRLRLLTNRLQAFRDNGDLPGHFEPSALAQLLITVVKGLAVQAASGTSREILHLVADQIMGLLRLGRHPSYPA